MSQANLKKCLIIGSPVMQSLSPLMHNAAYKALGIDNEYIFEAKEIPDEKLENEIQILREQNIAGISVTIPHKVSIMQYLDELDDVAQSIGAVNTIYRKDEKLCGTNTDWLGILNPLKEKTELKGKRAVIFGAGGAARAACYALSKASAEVTIVNRTKEKAAKLASDFAASYLGSNEVNNLNSFDIVINSVPYSSIDKILPFNPEYFTEKHIFFDMVYIPRETELIRAALQKKAVVIYGIEMLLHQGVEQFKVYTGINAPTDVMKKTLIDAI